MDGKGSNLKEVVQEMEKGYSKTKVSDSSIFTGQIRGQDWSMGWMVWGQPPGSGPGTSLSQPPAC